MPSRLLCSCRRALAACALALLASCGTPSDQVGAPPLMPPVRALVTVAQRKPGLPDGASGAAGSVASGAIVVARDGAANGTEIGRTTAAANGSFAEISLGDNLHSIIALVAMDSAGNQSGATIVTNDTIAPIPPVFALVTVAQRAPGFADGVSGAAGAVEAGVQVVARDGDASGAEIGRITADQDGSFPEISLGDNVHGTIALVAVDAAGNESAPTILLNDITPPGAPALTLLRVMQRAPGSADGVSGVAGAVEAGVQVVARDGDASGAEIGRTTADQDGSFPEISLGDNVHGTIALVAVDPVGNESATTVFTNDIVPPETNIDPGEVPTGAWVRLTAALTGDAVGFLCSLNGAPETACSSPFVLGPLAPGPHVFTVRAMDSAANVDPTPATRAWSTPACWSQVALGSLDGMPSGLGCAVANDGRLYCWGSPVTTGSIGSGDSLAYLTPQLVGTGFATVSAGTTHACGTKSDGSLWCWGDNTYGELGSGFPGTPALSPAQVGASTWEKVAVGVRYFTCAIDSTGTMSCWGDDLFGELGDGTQGAYRTAQRPVLAVATGTRWTEVTAGGGHACGVRDDGSLYCWGDNGWGQLGDGTTTLSNAPVRVPGSWRAVAAGYVQTCALDLAGALWCWGQYVASGSKSSTPVRISAQGGFRYVAAGDHHACAWDDGGHGTCFGSNVVGQLGDGLAQTSVTSHPQDFSVGMVAASGGTTCAVTTGGELRCFGSNVTGAVGVGTIGDSSTPRHVAPGSTFVSLSTFQGTTCAVTEDGARMCAGRNDYGQLGTGNFVSWSALTRSGPESDWLTASLSVHGGFGFRAGNVLYGWGQDTTGTLWGHATTATPIPMSVAGTWTALAAGWQHVLVLRPDGTAQGWGLNGWGQLGNGGTGYAFYSPTDAALGATWLELASGDMTSCGVRADGTLWCWGGNGRGQLGNGTASPTANPDPAQVGTLAGWTDVSIESAAACGIRNSALYCWGDGTHLRPWQLAPGTSFSRVSVGPDHACALGAGKLYCWGIDDRGQLGLGGPHTSAIVDPARVGSDTDWTAVAAGYGHTCGLKNGGELWCWGANGSGQLGDGTGFYAAPQVLPLPPP